MVYRLDKSGNRLMKLEETTYVDERVFEVAHIEEWVRKNPDLLCLADEQMKIISKQQVYETGKRSDLVAVDSFGQIVIIELKRAIAEPMSDFQAIRYASSYLYSTYDEICHIYALYLEQHRRELGIGEDVDFLAEACKEIENLCANVKLPEDFNKNQRIILVAREFSDDLLSAVSWLIVKGIEIRCVALAPYKHNEDLLIVPRVILPTPELSESIVPVRQADDKVKERRQRATHQIWEGGIEDHYSRLRSPLGEDLRRLVSEIQIQPEGLSGSGFHLVYGDRKIVVSTWAKGKIEFRFPKVSKSDLEALLQELGISSLKVKEKSDIESYGLANPTPAIDYRTKSVPLEDVTTLVKSWLGIPQ